MYVSGVNAEGVGVIVRLTDQGQTSEAFALPLGSAAAAPYIAAVHPSDPDTLFVRTDELILIDNTTTANDRLLMSRDGGETWIPIMQRHAKLLGFALSPDAGTLLAGYGDPILFSYSVEVDAVGIYRFDLDDIPRDADAGSGPTSDAAPPPDAGLTGNAPHQKIYDRSTTCLRWTPNALYGCFTQQQVGFEVGTAEVATAATLQFTPLLDLSTVRPLPCTEDSPVAQCLDDIIYGWPVACAKLGASCELDGSDGDAGPGALSAPADSGCNCRIAARSTGSEWAFVAAIWGLLGCFIGRRIALGTAAGRRLRRSRRRRVIHR
jgi:hypothetical protein